MSYLTTSQVLTECLMRAGVQRIYGLIGSSITPFFGMLCKVRDHIRYISTRHEQVAAAMADAEGRLTGKPGVVLLHAGAGALNGAIGLANAAKDCSPVLLIIGGVKRALAGLGGMLELDHSRIFGPYVKGFHRVSGPAQAVEAFAAAYRQSAALPPGPVVLEVPEDLWEVAEEVETLEFSLAEEALPQPNLDAVLEGLRAAQRPLLVAGGGAQHYGPAVFKFVEASRFPTVTTGNGRGLVPEDHHLCYGRAGYAGGSAAADYALYAADFILFLGCGLSDILSYDYTRVPAGRMAFLNGDGAYLEQIHRRLPEALTVHGDVGAALEVLAGAGLRGLCNQDWWNRLETARSAWQQYLDQCAYPAWPMPSTYALRRLAERLPRNAIVTCGTGLHLLSVNAALPCLGPRQYLSACNFGAMGFAFGAAMAARLLYPDRRVVCAIGDGDFLMTSADLETAVREDLMPLVVILNDRGYGALRTLGILRGFRYGADHGNPDFAGLAAAYGLVHARAQQSSDVDTAFRRALEPNGPQIVEIVVDPSERPPANWQAILAMKG